MTTFGYREDIKCCRIGCPRIAEYQIRDLGALPDPYSWGTLACGDHLAELLEQRVAGTAVQVISTELLGFKSRRESARADLRAGSR